MSDSSDGLWGINLPHPGTTGMSSQKVSPLSTSTKVLSKGSQSKCSLLMKTKIKSTVDFHCARNCSKCFTWTNSFNPSNSIKYNTIIISIPRQTWTPRLIRCLIQATLIHGKPVHWIHIWLYSPPSCWRGQWGKDMAITPAQNHPGQASLNQWFISWQ